MFKILRAIFVAFAVLVVSLVYFVQTNNPERGEARSDARDLFLKQVSESWSFEEIQNLVGPERALRDLQHYLQIIDVGNTLGRFEYCEVPKAKVVVSAHVKKYGRDISERSNCKFSNGLAAVKLDMLPVRGSYEVIYFDLKRHNK